MKKVLSAILLLVIMASFIGCKDNNVVIINGGSTPKPDVTEPTDYQTECWVAVDIPFTAQNSYSKPFYDVLLDVTFTSPSGTEYVMPAFWDGGSAWKVRFAPTEYGVWKFEAKANVDDAGFVKSGTLAANEYKGDLAVYKHGFVTSRYGKKYFTYDDGTPFFYLGDTHWSMFSEDFDTQFKTVVDKRVEQGFTVYQSQPTSEKTNLAGSFPDSAIEMMQELDRRFRYIAQAGLTHPHSQFFFTEKMSYTVMRNTEYLDLLARYWVARFSAYPVMWTLAQECDNDFYGNDIGQQTVYTPENNPWKFVAQCLAKYDPYNHPLTAHQETSDCTTVTGAGTKNYTKGASAFKDMKEHTWYAAQWKPDVSKQYSVVTAKDYWDSGKICVNYESKYAYLATKDAGARRQGWISYLAGMFGYGYGASDIWYINSANSYLVGDVNDGLETLTQQEKTDMTWDKAVNLPSAVQCGYMRKFFEGIAWYSLEPDFDGKAFTVTVNNTEPFVAANAGNDLYVCYLYGKLRISGTFRGLDTSKTYTAKWFDPRTGEYIDISGSIASEDGTYTAPQKPGRDDYVLLVMKNK